MTRTALLAAACALAFAFAGPANADTIDLSAQQKCPKGGCKTRSAPKPAQPQRVQQPRVQQQRVQQPRVQQRAVQPRVQQRTVQPPRVQQRTVQPQIQRGSGARVITRNNAAPRALTFKPNRSTYAVRIRAGNSYSYRGRNYSLWRTGPWRHRYGNRWRTYVALTTLGAIAVGASSYYPYAYIDAPAEACEGITEDGCQLVYDEVETLEGGTAPVCVAYCPQ